MGIKTDFEIVTELVEKFKDENTDVLQKLQVLAELEYYLHQVGYGQYQISVSAKMLILFTEYSRTSMARTPLGP